MNDELTSDRWWLLSSSKSERKDLAPYLARLDVINAFETELSRLADGELRERAEVLKRRARAGEALEALLPECFALARETARRTLGERPYEVQLLAGIALHEGKLVEMRSRSGSTPASSRPSSGSRSTRTASTGSARACSAPPPPGPTWSTTTSSAATPS